MQFHIITPFLPASPSTVLAFPQAIVRFLMTASNVIGSHNRAFVHRFLETSVGVLKVAVFTSLQAITLTKAHRAEVHQSFFCLIYKTTHQMHKIEAVNMAKSCTLQAFTIFHQEPGAYRSQQLHSRLYISRIKRFSLPCPTPTSIW